MAAKKPEENTIYDGIFAQDLGVNTGLLPSLLPANQLANAVNCTVRGGFPMPRASIRKCDLDFGGDAVLQHLFEDGRFQGHCYYQPDSGPESLIAAIGGHLFKITVVNHKFTVSNVTISHITVTTAPYIVPPINGAVAVTVGDTTNLKAGVAILIGTHNYVILTVDSPTQITVKNIDDVPGTMIVSGAIVTFFDVNPASLPQTWMWQAEKWVIVNDGQSQTIFYDGATARRSNGLTGSPPEVSAGRMGTYWKGRIWWCNPDGITFRAGDIVYSSSGTPGEKFRDAILRQTQNTFLATGGNFSVPGSAGFIQAMRFVNILDTSLGQGPLQILTPNLIFGNDAPVDNTIWQSATSVLLAVSQISYGGVSQWATILVNGDMLYRSKDGIRSLVIGRRDVVQWGNVPISREVALYLDRDDPTLLNFCSAIFFDNRVLMTTSPVFTDHGCYHRGLVALNFDVISNISGKKPSVWEGLWTGINTLGLVKGDFASVERAFAFSFNTGTSKIELYEILPSASDIIRDNNGQDAPIQWSFETHDLFRETGIKEYKRVRLTDGEFYIDDVRGRVDFRVLFRPDQYPCWIEWCPHTFVCADEHSCASDNLTDCVTIKEFKPQYRVRLGLGEPPTVCDPVTDKPFREGYTFQVRFEVQGHCRIGGARFSAVPTPQPKFAEVACCDQPPAPPPPAVTYFNTEQSYTAHCPAGEFGPDVTRTVAANVFTSTISQEDADTQAFSSARQQALDALVCDGCAFDEGIEAKSYQLQGYFDGMVALCALDAGGTTWDGQFTHFVEGAPDQFIWNASVLNNTLEIDTVDGGQIIANATITGTCVANATDFQWTLNIFQKDFGGEIWSGTKAGGGNPTGLYTQVGGCSPAGDLTVNEA